METPTKDLNATKPLQENQMNGVYPPMNGHKSADTTRTNNGTNGMNGTLASPEEIIPHRLQNRWTLWYDNPGKKTAHVSWEDNLKKIVTIDTVEGFWQIYNNIRPASQLPTGSNYHFFREGVKPMWEHPENVQGGKWLCSVPKTKRELLDQMWMYALLAVIGESLTESENEISGLVVSVRKTQDRISLWTKTADNATMQREIGRILRSSIDLPDSILLGYQSHADSMKRGTSFNTRNRYEV